MKNWKHLASGLLGLLLLASLAGSAFAAGGTAKVSKAGIMYYDTVEVEPGEEYTDSAGNQIPAALAYTDSAGKTTNYLPVPMLQELLDMEIKWKENYNSIVFGYLGEDMEITSGFSQEGDMPTYPSKPVLGIQDGPYTEIDPSVVDRTKGFSVMSADKARIQSFTGSGEVDSFSPLNGQYIVYEVTNNSSDVVRSVVRRVRTLPGTEAQKFTTVDIQPGETLVRAFQLDSDAEDMACTLGFYAGIPPYKASADNITDVTISLMQYK